MPNFGSLTTKTVSCLVFVVLEVEHENEEDNGYSHGSQDKAVAETKKERSQAIFNQKFFSDLLEIRWGESDLLLLKINKAITAKMIIMAIVARYGSIAYMSKTCV